MTPIAFDAFNLGDLAPSTQDPDALALISLDAAGHERRITYGEIDHAAQAAARGLVATGLRAGERIAILSENRPEFLTLVLGALRAGIVVVPVNYRFPQNLVQHVLHDSGAQMVFCTPDQRAKITGIRHVVTFGTQGPGSYADFIAPGPFDTHRPGPDDPALILYTSGSTGRPKGVVLSHRSHLWVVKTRLADTQGTDPLSYLVAAPLYHMNALALCQLALAGGDTIVLLPRFEARGYIAAASRYRANWLTLVPPMMAMILREKDALDQADLSAVQVVRMGSAPVSAALVKAIHAIMPDVRIINSYGTTEGGPITFSSSPLDKPQPLLSIGHTHPQVAVRLRDESGQLADQGVLEVRSPGLMLGYHNLPKRTAAALTADGYYITGDVLRRDADGFFYFVGRNDDMFVCGGENIFPSEVENVLIQHPGIQQACAVAIPDEIKGKKPVAFVVPAPGADLDDATLKDWFLARAPAYQHPRHIWFIPELPLASTGKIDRQQLTERALQAIQTPVPH